MFERFKFCPTPLQGIFVIERKLISDNRGFLSRVFCSENFQSIGMSEPISQINHTHTRRKGTIRGMHFQNFPHSECKIVTCIKGQIFDVAVDIREHSPTYLKWYSKVLSKDNCKSLFIPEGFAHGFQALTNDCELLYFHTKPYSSESEGALNAMDPKLAIQWPLEATDRSERDKNHPMINII
jgi:dTDP-4-dehydrorhamnose 3,5-epimerase